MKYYLIVGEASGDLHAANLMRSLKKEDAEAQFRFFGGDNMCAVGGTMVKHYKELAYMGFIPVLLHLPTILRNMKMCKQDIMQWQPDVVILVDYAGFNLNIAKFLREQRNKTSIAKNNSLPIGEGWGGATYYYIAPKLWAWKEYRIKNIKRDVDELFSILPFEEEFFEGKHGYPIHYVGNPTADEVRNYRYDASLHPMLEQQAVGEASSSDDKREIADDKRETAGGKKIIALLAGSRRQEIKDNLPAMIEATMDLADYRCIIACAPGIEQEYYLQFTKDTHVELLTYSHSEKEGGSSTYALLTKAVAALVTSGTATLETCQFDVPQVVCYKTPVPKLCRWGFNNILKVRYISLVNLIADSEVVPELFADRFSVGNIRQQLLNILPGGADRQRMLDAYKQVHKRLGDICAPDNAARTMVELLRG